mgnify:CR=1 FL=1
MFYVVAYDMPDTKRRTKLFKAMKGFGRHTQFSVFECELNQKGVERMVKKIASLIEPAEDNIKIYPLCKSCLDDVQLVGIARLIRKPETLIV